MKSITKLFTVLLVISLAVCGLCACKDADFDNQSGSIIDDHEENLNIVNQLAVGLYGLKEDRQIISVGTTVILGETCETIKTYMTEAEAYFAHNKEGKWFVSEKETNVYREVIVDPDAITYMGAVVTQPDEGAMILFTELLGKAPECAEPDKAINLNGASSQTYTATTGDAVEGSLAVTADFVWYFAFEGEAYHPMTYSRDRASFDSSVTVNPQ